MHFLDAAALAPAKTLPKPDTSTTTNNSYNPSAAKLELKSEAQQSPAKPSKAQ